MASSSTTAQTTPVQLTSAPRSNRARLWASFRRNRIAMIGLAIVVTLSLAALLAPIIAPYDPIVPDYGARLQPPSRAHLLGTDELGRDIFSRLLYGARISMVIGFVAQGVAITLGVILGSIAGWYGGWVDDAIMRVTDVFFAIPGLMFLIVWVTIFEASAITLFLGLGLISWPSNARMMRSQVLVIKELDYVIAARMLGASTFRILWRHVLPNAIAPMIVLASLGIAGVILSESVLSFLGLGISIPNPSWGTMVDIGRNYTTNAWWYAVFPGLVIMLTVLGFNFLGDGLRDALDPRSYER